MKLYETTNVIEMHYGNSPAWATTRGAGIGINSDNGTRGHSVSGSPNLTTMPSNNYRYAPIVTNPLPNKAASPSPADMATGIPAGGTNLSWTSNGTQYDVYLDTANPPLQVLASNHATGTIASGSLRAGTQYYWRVIAKNANGAVLGDVWSSTTN